MSVHAARLTAPRPRLLLVLAIIGFFHGTMGSLRAWNTIKSFTGSHDVFLSAVQREASQALGLDPSLGTATERERVAARKAEALWSRRGVLLPLAGAAGISAILILLGSLRSATRILRPSDWGRAAWQLGALIGVPCLVLETIVGDLHIRDLAVALADLTDPLSVTLREHVALQRQVLFALAALSAFYMLGVARYLGSAAVKRYFASGSEGTD